MTARKDQTGPVKPREMTKIRDRVGKLRDEARVGGYEALEKKLERLWVDLDRLDLRYKLHHDKIKGEEEIPHQRIRADADEGI
jgi:hypothetical protein